MQRVQAEFHTIPHRRGSQMKFPPEVIQFIEETIAKALLRAEKEAA